MYGEYDSMRAWFQVTSSCWIGKMGQMTDKIQFAIDRISCEVARSSFWPVCTVSNRNMVRSMLSEKTIRCSICLRHGVEVEQAFVMDTQNSPSGTGPRAPRLRLHESTELVPYPFFLTSDKMV